MTQEYIDTTDENFAVFKAETERLRREIGLDDVFKFITECAPCQEEPSNAELGVNLEQRKVWLRLNKRQPVGYTSPEWMKYNARHEFAHAFLLPLANLAWSRFVTEEEIAAAEHEVVNRLVRLFERLIT